MKCFFLGLSKTSHDHFFESKPSIEEEDELASNYHLFEKQDRGEYFPDFPQLKEMLFMSV